MADLTITAANVIPAANSNIVTGFAGEAITAGKSVYIDPATQAVKLADNDAVDPNLHNAVGVSLNGAATGQPVSFTKSGDLAVGAVLTKGVTYCVSATPGGICPQADLTTGKELVIVGIASTTSNLQVGIRDTDVVL